MTSAMLVLSVVVLAISHLLSAFADQSTTDGLLWPVPKKSTFGKEVYLLQPESFQFLAIGAGADSDIVKDAFSRYSKILFTTPVPFVPTGATQASDGVLASLNVVVNSADETLGQDTDESYTLTVGGGSGRLIAQTVYGMLRGLETFSQLVYRNTADKYAINQVDIDDAPRFKFRGTMIDTSRHYLTVNTIMMHLDAMAYNKMNVLHWHIVDDQSFPYVSTKFPALSEKGSYTPESVYSQESIQKIIQHAKYRGIRVIPEFDTPGHTQSWGKAYPDILTPCYVNGKPDGSFGPINPIDSMTFPFLTDLYKEINDVFPDQYVHLGGDEVSFSCWQSNPNIQKWIAARNATDYAVLEQFYENSLLELVENIGKSYVVWQEILDNGLKIKKDTVVDVWKGGWQEEMDKVTAAGYDVILSAPWYLNYISYGSDWVTYYTTDPHDFNGTQAQYDQVIGGEACMWAEYVDSTNMLSRFWPRASAIAERLWSQQSVNDTQSAVERIHLMKCRMMSRGVAAEPSDGPSFCATEWDPAYTSI